MPRELLHAKLHRHQMIAKAEQNKIVVLKWWDTRDARILSTKHAPYMRNITGDEEEDAGADGGCSADQPSTSRASNNNRKRKNKQKPISIPAINLSIGSNFVMCHDPEEGYKAVPELDIQYLVDISLVNAFVNI